MVSVSLWLFSICQTCQFLDTKLVYLHVLSHESSHNYSSPRRVAWHLSYTSRQWQYSIAMLPRVSYYTLASLGVTFKPILCSSYYWSKLNHNNLIARNCVIVACASQISRSSTHIWSRSVVDSPQWTVMSQSSYKNYCYTYTLLILKWSSHCIFHQSRAHQEVKKAVVVSFWTKCFQWNLHNSYVEKATKSLTAPCFQRINQVCGS